MVGHTRRRSARRCYMDIEDIKVLEQQRVPKTAFTLKDIKAALKTIPKGNGRQGTTVKRKPSPQIGETVVPMSALIDNVKQPSQRPSTPPLPHRSTTSKPTPSAVKSPTPTVCGRPVPVMQPKALTDAEINERLSRLSRNDLSSRKFQPVNIQKSIAQQSPQKSNPSSKQVLTSPPSTSGAAKLNGKRKHTPSTNKVGLRLFKSTESDSEMEESSTIESAINLEGSVSEDEEDSLESPVQGRKRLSTLSDSDRDSDDSDGIILLEDGTFHEDEQEADASDDDDEDSISILEDPAYEEEQEQPTPRRKKKRITYASEQYSEKLAIDPSEVESQWDSVHSTSLRRARRRNSASSLIVVDDSDEIEYSSDDSAYEALNRAMSPFKNQKGNSTAMSPKAVPRIKARSLSSKKQTFQKTEHQTKVEKADIPKKVKGRISRSKGNLEFRAAVRMGSSETSTNSVPSSYSLSSDDPFKIKKSKRAKISKKQQVTELPAPSLPSSTERLNFKELKMSVPKMPKTDVIKKKINVVPHGLHGAEAVVPDSDGVSSTSPVPKSTTMLPSTLPRTEVASMDPVDKPAPTPSASTDISWDKAESGLVIPQKRKNKSTANGVSTKTTAANSELSDDKPPAETSSMSVSDEVKKHTGEKRKSGETLLQRRKTKSIDVDQETDTSILPLKLSGKTKRDKSPDVIGKQNSDFGTTSKKSKPGIPFEPLKELSKELAMPSIEKSTLSRAFSSSIPAPISKPNSETEKLAGARRIHKISREYKATTVAQPGPKIISVPTCTSTSVPTSVKSVQKSASIDPRFTAPSTVPTETSVPVITIPSRPYTAHNLESAQAPLQNSTKPPLTAPFRTALVAASSKEAGTSSEIAQHDALPRFQPSDKRRPNILPKTSKPTVPKKRDTSIFIESEHERRMKRERQLARQKSAATVAPTMEIEYDDSVNALFEDDPSMRSGSPFSYNEDRVADMPGVEPSTASSAVPEPTPVKSAEVQKVVQSGVDGAQKQNLSGPLELNSPQLLRRSNQQRSGTEKITTFGKFLGFDSDDDDDKKPVVDTTKLDAMMKQLGQDEIVEKKTSSQGEGMAITPVSSSTSSPARPSATQGASVSSRRTTSAGSIDNHDFDPLKRQWKFSQDSSSVSSSGVPLSKRKRLTNSQSGNLDNSGDDSDVIAIPIGASRNNSTTTTLDGSKSKPKTKNYLFVPEDSDDNASMANNTGATIKIGELTLVGLSSDEDDDSSDVELISDSEYMRHLAANGISGP